jgi:1-acyl-sn-glycerol-3-phosphate acyltransferase
MRAWGRAVCRVLGYRVTAQGPLPPPGSLVVPNHISYTDVFPLMACQPCFFVPKAEVARWLVIGMIVRGTEMIFTTRRLGARDLLGAAAAIQERLREGLPVCVFLEGTTTSGDHILPFRAAFVQPAVDCGAPIVPAAVRWRATRPGTSIREDVAFWKDHIFFPHFWRHMGLGGFEIEITYGAPIPSANQNRKALAAQVRDKLLEMWTSSERETPGATRRPAPR